MAFVNEYVPPLEQETSAFFRAARVKLRTGHTKWDMWTVDRENEMVLCRTGGGHSIESHNNDFWSFIDQKGLCYAITELRAKSETSPDDIAFIRSISFQTGPGVGLPDAPTIACIKKALCEYKDLGAASTYRSGSLTLIDAITGQEI